MKKVFTLISLFFCGFSVNAQETIAKVEVKSTPAIAMVEEVLGLKETEFDFGKIPQGKPVTHIFEIKNNGKDSLKIVNVQASCGCTTPVWEHDKPVATGAKTKIDVGYNAAAAGPFVKTITITYNGTESKQITIKGEVWQTPAASAPENNATKDLKNN